MARDMNWQRPAEWMGLSMPVMQSCDKIELGHRYRQVTGGSGVWIAVGFITDHAGNPHAQLMLERDRTRIITIACAALDDRRFYERLSGSGLLTESRDGNDKEDRQFSSLAFGKLA
jgi:hypothetical protein